jgi:DNA-directed RNA polymerase alpha subunit
MPSRRLVRPQTQGVGESLPPSLSRAARAYALDAIGKTYEEIGAELGVRRNMARTLAMQWQRHVWALERLRECPGDLQALADAGQLSRRLAYALTNVDVRTVEDMAALDEQDWHRIPLIGPASVREAKAFLAQRAGRPEPDQDPEHGIPI